MDGAFKMDGTAKDLALTNLYPGGMIHSNQLRLRIFIRTEIVDEDVAVPNNHTREEAPPAESASMEGMADTTSESAIKACPQTRRVTALPSLRGAGCFPAIRVEPWSICFIPCFLRGMGLFLFHPPAKMQGLPPQGEDDLK